MVLAGQALPTGTKNSRSLATRLVSVHGQGGLLAISLVDLVFWLGKCDAEMNLPTSQPANLVLLTILIDEPQGASIVYIRSDMGPMGPRTPQAAHETCPPPRSSLSRTATTTSTQSTTTRHTLPRATSRLVIMSFPTDPPERAECRAQGHTLPAVEQERARPLPRHLHVPVLLVRERLRWLPHDRPHCGKHLTTKTLLTPRWHHSRNASTTLARADR